MMKKIFDIERYSIMLECCEEKGSGVFMSSKSPEYDYIITAKHCLNSYKKPLDILFPNNGFCVKDVFKHSTLDLAIIQVDKSDDSSFFSFVNTNELEKYVEKMYLYGYPKLLREDVIKYCKLECKNPAIANNLIRLELFEEISTFRDPAIELLKGMSGCPVYIQKNGVVIIIGIYYENSHKNFAYRHINIIPLDTIQEFIRNSTLEDLNLSFCSELLNNDLDPLYTNYDNLVRDDFRNLKKKILDVSPNYNNRKIGLLSRKIGNTISEMDNLSNERKAALLYRVFLSANEKQLDLIIENKNLFSETELESWIDIYTDYAKKIINDKSEEYNYCLRSRDIIKGIVLQLIDDCYISFDEEGFYDKEGDENK